MKVHSIEPGTATKRLPVLSPEQAETLGITSDLVEMRKRSPNADAVRVRYADGSTEAFGLAPAAAAAPRMTDVQKFAAANPAPIGELMSPVNKVAREHNGDVLKMRKSALNSYVEKVATARRVSVEHAHGDLNLDGDVEYARLTKSIREAEQVAASPGNDPALFRSWQADRDAEKAAEVRKQSAADAARLGRMTPSEKKLHELAAERAVTKGISHGSAMSELIETSREARDLARNIDFEKAGIHR
jgi:hypothetical protein